MDPASETEEELIARWQGGDASALDPLLAPHLPALRRHLAARYGDEVAEEAVGELGVKLARGVSYEHRGAFRAWLQTLGRRTAIDVIRRHRRLERLARNVEEELDPVVTHGAERRVRGERRRRRVDRFLDGLPTLHRTAIRMRYWRGASTEEIAEELEMSAGQVRDRLAYALRALRKRMRTRTLD